MTESSFFLPGVLSVPTQAPHAPPPPPPASAVPAPVRPSDPTTAPAVVVRGDQVHANATDVTLDQMLEWMVAANASDLHLASNAQPRARLHGELAPLDGVGRIPADRLRGMLTQIMNERQRVYFQEHNDIDLPYALGTRARFRVNVFQQRGHIGAVMRLIPTDIMTAEDMNLPVALTSLAALPRGLVLVTGPTGSGKSTLLAAIVDLANRTRKAHIVTIEDPIEFTHTSKLATVTQRQVGEDTDSFATGLRAVLREDPDIILVGEMRDLETTRAALEAAETGHLVFATLHTKSAPEAVSRVVNQFPDEVQNQIQTTLAATLEAVITQTLVRRQDAPGRIAAREVMILDHSSRNLIRQGKLEQLPSVLQTGSDRGSHTLSADLARLVNEGLISYTTAAEVASDLDELNQRTRRR
jgi:twitching motility protein PilT